jgi:hypothetical protein
MRENANRLFMSFSVNALQIRRPHLRSVVSLHYFRLLNGMHIHASSFVCQASKFSGTFTITTQETGFCKYAHVLI